MKKKNYIIGIIPARMASTRFPGKPLAEICGIPMVGHVYFRSKMSQVLDEVYIATCNKEVMDYASSINAKAIMTKNTHERASERAAEAVLKIEKILGHKLNIVVMIQGDEPLLHPRMVDEALGPILRNKKIQITNLMGKLCTTKDFENPNEVKLVVDKFNNALYFSREPIPSRKKYSGKVPMLKQIPIIPFRRDFLLEYTKMKPTPLEIVESVDMMRILENGLKIKMVETKHKTKAVDTKEDLMQVRRMMQDDRLFKRYGR